MIDFRIKSSGEAIALVGWSTLAVYCSWVAVRLFVWCWQTDAFYWAFCGILW